MLLKSAAIDRRGGESVRFGWCTFGSECQKELVGGIEEMLEGRHGIWSRDDQKNVVGEAAGVSIVCLDQC